MICKRWPSVPFKASAAALIVLLASCAMPSREAGIEPGGKTATVRNVVIFVADGLRAGSINETDAPTFLALRRGGVYFANSHSLFPTFTTPNASAIATGHYLGDSGDFGNSGYVGFQSFSTGNFGHSPAGPMPFLENDQVLADLDDHQPNRNYLGEQTLLAAARAAGFNTAAIGKIGPAAIQDVTQINPVAGRFVVPQTVILDDASGTDAGVPIAESVRAAILAAGLTPAPPPRNQPAGTLSRPGTLSANIEQQRWLADATTRAVLPMFKASGKPFVLVYWSRDPDATQHNQGDSLNRLAPGINGPTSRAAVANADRNLKQILDYIAADPRLRETTDVLVTADHGFATISRHFIDPAGGGSASYSTRFTYLDADGQPAVVPGWLPPGFLAIDLAHALSLPLFDADTLATVDGVQHYAPVEPAVPASEASRQWPAQGNGILGGAGIAGEHAKAKVIVSAGGGSDLIYLPDRDRGLARRIVEFLSHQDYVGALFADSRLGAIPGALPMELLGLEGATHMPKPSIVVAFRSFANDATDPVMSTVQVSDSGLQQGQGMHGGLNRASTFVNMAALGPDFKHGFIDESPVGNADIVPTAARLLGLKLPVAGHLGGRVIEEALAAGPVAVRSRLRTRISRPDPAGTATVLHFQEAAGRRYFDSACLVARQKSESPCDGDPIASGVR